MKVFIVLFLCLLAQTAYGIETVVNPTNNNESMRGCFSTSCIANPNDVLFSHVKTWSGGLYSLYEYRFTGRTGDKNFEVSLKTQVYRVSNTTKKISLYFEENGSIQLEMGGYNEKFWPPHGRIILKTIKLQGNQLEYQIIIPNKQQEQPLERL